MLITAAISSLKVREDLGQITIFERIKNLRKLLKEELSKLNLELLDQRGKNFQSGIISFKHQNAENIYKDLLRNNVTTAIREGILRVSPHFYNNEDDINLFVKKLYKLL